MKLKWYFSLVCSFSLIGVTKPPPASLIPNSGRKTSYPFVSGDTFRAFSDHIIDHNGNVPWDRIVELFNPKDVKDGDVIYVKTGMLPRFFEKVRPFFNAKYILITHNDDRAALGFANKYNILKDPNLIVWFSQNKSAPLHPKLIGLPIGVANRYWLHGDIHTLQNAIDNAPLPKDRRSDKLVYLNFTVGTNAGRRKPAWDYFINKPFCYVAKGRSFATYLNEMSQCRFVLSPRGNALDSHRTWEALLLGAIPIIPKTRADFDEIYADLPVVMVDKWEQVNKKFLEKKFEEIEKKKKLGLYNINKIYADYWFKLIKSYQLPYKS